MFLPVTELLLAYCSVVCIEQLHSNSIMK